MERLVSIGGWCIQNRGVDPFGGPTRDFSLANALEAAAEAEINLISWHDGDLWPDGASWQQIEDRIGEVKVLCDKFDLSTLNYTTNTFSNAAFRSGAFSSPFEAVRRAAIAKGCVGMAAGKELGAESVIFWGGREGDDGAHAHDAGRGLEMYLQGVATCAEYAAEMLAYNPVISIEPKVYEPRMAGLYPSTAATVLAGLSCLSKSALMSKWASKIRLNPEYPQHLGMLGMSPVLELEMLLRMQRLAPFLHFGGQIAGRMDCDMLPFMGDYHATNLQCWLALQRYGWDGVIELDCRPLRTTTTLAGLQAGLKRSVGYIRRLEQLAEEAEGISEIADTYHQLADQSDPDTNPLDVPWQSPEVLADEVDPLLEAANLENTDCIEAYQAALVQLLIGQ